MNNRYSHVLIIILALLISLSCLAGCADQHEKEGDSSQLHQAKEKMQTQWFALLKANETVYSGLFRTLEYMEDYGKENSWDSLLKARASASAALVELRQMEIPAMALTEEEIHLLINADIEVNAIQREFEALENWHDSMDGTVSLLCYTLDDDVFMKANAENMIPAMSTFYQDYFILEYRYLCYFTNYLLLQMNSTNTWQAWTTQLPCMAACMDSWYEKTSELEAATGQLLDTMHALLPQMSSFTGTSEYSLEVVQDALETGNLDSLKREINIMTGVPGYFPIPAWLPDAVSIYLITDPDTQEKRLVHSGEELNCVPSSCYFSCGELPIDDVQSYEERLKLWNIDTFGKWNESRDTWQLIANSGSSTMLVEWTQKDTLIYLTEPIGCLIPELYLQVMIAE